MIARRLPLTPPARHAVPCRAPRRQASRAAILGALSRLLPHSLPFGLAPPGSPSPAERLTGFVDGQIAKFQLRVAAKAQEHLAETRWFWQRGLESFAANFRCVL